LVTKVYFPRLILPVTPILSTLIDFGVGFAVLLIMMAVNRFTPSVTIVAIPIVLAGALSLALGLSLFASAMQVKYRDVQYVVPVFVNMLLFISPTGYALSEIGKKVPESAQGIYTLNPLVGLLELGRWTLLGTPFPGFTLALYSLGSSIAILLLGMFYFKSQERGFADVI
jgi:lipopolysaccharide transport system permease protein